MARGAVAQRVQDILKSLKDSGLNLEDVDKVTIDYKEMGEFKGDVIMPVINIKKKR